MALCIPECSIGSVANSLSPVVSCGLCKLWFHCGCLGFPESPQQTFTGIYLCPGCLETLQQLAISNCERESRLTVLENVVVSLKQRLDRLDNTTSHVGQYTNIADAGAANNSGNGSSNPEVVIERDGDVEVGDPSLPEENGASHEDQPQCEEHNDCQLEPNDQIDKDGEEAQSASSEVEEDKLKIEEQSNEMVPLTLDKQKFMSTDGRSHNPYNDSFLYCDQCHLEHYGNCQIHGPMIRIHDTLLAGSDPNRANHSVPWGFIVAESSIPGAGYGVFADIDVPKGTVFGPYEGKELDISSPEALSSEYCWLIHGPTEPTHCIDGKDLAISNWMRYVNCACNYNQQNLKAFQYKGHIFYRSIKKIYKGTELLVWYGSDYAEVLGLNYTLSEQSARSSSIEANDSDSSSSVKCKRKRTAVKSTRENSEEDPHQSPPPKKRPSAMKSVDSAKLSKKSNRESQDVTPETATKNQSTPTRKRPEKLKIGDDRDRESSVSPKSKRPSAMKTVEKVKYSEKPRHRSTATPEQEIEESTGKLPLATKIAERDKITDKLKQSVAATSKLAIEETSAPIRKRPLVIKTIERSKISEKLNSTSMVTPELADVKHCSKVTKKRPLEVKSIKVERVNHTPGKSPVRDNGEQSSPCKKRPSAFKSHKSASAFLELNYLTSGEDEQSASSKKSKSASKSGPKEKSDDDPRPFTCFKCGYAQKTLGHMREHMFYKHTLNIFNECSECGFQHLTMRNLVAHQKETGHSGKKLAHVEYQFAKEDGASPTDEEGRLQCQQCNFTSKKLFSLAQHRVSVH